MRTFDQHWLLEGVAKEMRRVASGGIWNGREIRTASQYQAEGRKPYFERCRAFHADTGTFLIFTRAKPIGMRSRSARV